MTHADGVGAPPAAHAPLQDRLLSASWQLLALLERLPPAQAQRLLAAQRDAEVAHARARLAPLDPWPGLPAAVHANYTSDASAVRLARALDFVQDGDRVLDVGVGPGYVAGLLLRQGRIERYAGIDASQRLVRIAEAAVEAAGGGAGRAHVEQRDVHDLDAEWAAAHAPTLVLLLEVLEYLDDPAGALAAIRRAVDPGASLLLTVPLFGRQEEIWGHRAVFEQRHLKDLVEGAGFTVQYAEPLHATWTLLLATASPEVPEARLAAGVAGATPPVLEPAPHDHAFTEAALDGPVEDHRPQGSPQRNKATVTVTGDGVRAELEGAEPDGRPRCGGVAVPVRAPGVLRLQVLYEDAQGVDSVVVDGYAGTERVARWRWNVGSQPPEPGTRLVHVIRPGGGGRFQPQGAIRAERIERIELSVCLREGAAGAAFTLQRVSYAGGWTG